MANSQIRRGALAEASRTLHALIDMDPEDAETREILTDIESRMQLKRRLINELRTLVNTSRFEEAVEMWDQMEPWQREEGLRRQIEMLRGVTIPVARINEEGEEFLAGGSYEEAIEKFEAGLVLDSESEQAKQGIKNAGHKLRRIQAWLKEGYECAMRQEYEAAIRTWEYIFRVSSDHREAKSRIALCRLEWGYDLQKRKAPLQKIVEQWEAVLAIDPDHGKARRLHEDGVGRLKELLVLEAQASEAKRKGGLARAVRAWKKMLEIDPNQRSAANELRLVRRKLLVRRIEFGVGLVIFAFLLLCAAQVYYERDWIGAVKRLRDDGNPASLREAQRLIEKVERRGRARFLGEYFLGRIIIFNRPWWPAEKFTDLWWEDISLDVRREHRYRTAEKKKKLALEKVNSGEWQAAMAALKEAIRHMKSAAADGRSKERKKKIEQEVLVLKYHRARAEGRLAEEMGNWRAARQAYRDGASLAGEAGLTAEADALRKREGFVSRRAAARDDERAGRMEEAARKLRECYAFFPKEDGVREALARMGVYPREAETEVARVRELVRNGKLYEMDLIEEIMTRLARAGRRDRFRKDVPGLTQFARDCSWCLKQRMVLVAPDDPLAGWSGRERRRAFCIDQYEFPTVPLERPVFGTSFATAKAKCSRAGKRLCRLAEWQLAARGRAGHQYPYGNKYQSRRCNTEGPGPITAGQLAGCVSPFGAYDMSGNVQEWAYDEKSSRQTGQPLCGGNWSSGARATTQSATYVSGGRLHARAGWRCCLDLP